MATITLPDGVSHDDCNQTIDELRKVIAAQRELLESTTATLNAAIQTIDSINAIMQLAPAPAPAKRNRGRPSKVTDDSLLLDGFNSMKADFVAAHKLEKPTDSAVLNWYFEQAFAQYGRRISTVKSKQFQGKLKRLKNRLGDIRNPIVKIPIK